MNKVDIEPALLNGVIDFGIGPSPMESKKTRTASIYSEPLLYLSGGGVPGDSIILHDINGKTVLFVQDDCGLAGAMRLLFSQNDIAVSEYEGRALSYSILENWVKLGLGATLLPAYKVLDIGTAKRIDNNNGSLVSIEFQACWLESQQDRRCFNLVFEGLNFAA